MTPSLHDLTTRFASVPGLTFDAEKGLTRLKLQTAAAEIEVFLQGAHIAHFRAAGQEPLLFLSDEAIFQEDTPIRGGIPIIFPWFGTRRHGRSADAHGFARNTPWELTGVQLEPEVMLSFELTPSARTQLEWLPDFRVRYFVYAGEELTLSLEVENLSETSFIFEAALHTYFAVSDIRSVRVTGLDGVEFLNQLATDKQLQSGDIHFAGETDNIYFNVPETITIEDSGLQRAIEISSNALSAIVWNPWIGKAARLKDFGDDEWQRMVCVESGAVQENEVEIFPGEITTLSVTYRSTVAAGIDAA